MCYSETLLRAILNEEHFLIENEPSFGGLKIIMGSTLVGWVLSSINDKWIYQLLPEKDGYRFSFDAPSKEKAIEEIHELILDHIRYVNENEKEIKRYFEWES